MSAVRLPKGQLYDGKYHIYDPSAVNFQQRTEFLQSIAGTHDYEVPLEDVCNNYNTAGARLYDLAVFYGMHKARGARLPKFSKWVLGMYASDKDLSQRIAELGKSAGKKKVVISTDLVDILRSGNSSHFNSCFGLDRGSESQGLSPVYIAEEAPGIGILYVNDEKGFMMGRWWLHHVRDKDGKDMVMLPPYQIGNLKMDVAVAALRSKGATVCWSENYAVYCPDKKFRKIKATPVGGYPMQRYHDINFEEGMTYNVLVEA